MTEQSTPNTPAQTEQPTGPIHVGEKVVYRGGETHQQGATIGIYTLYSTDEVTMHGYVEVQDANGNVFPIDARLLERAPAGS